MIIKIAVTFDIYGQLALTKVKNSELHLTSKDKVNNFTSCCDCVKARISKPRRASGKARSLVKLLQFSLGASSISIVQWS